MSHLVTGDAVVLGLQPAKLPSRAVGIALDLLVYVGGYLVLSLLLVSTVLPLGTATAAAVQVALVLLIVIGAPVAVETLSQGRSLGKLATGLRVVREDGGPIRFRHALVRGLIGFVEILVTVGFVACVSSLISERGRRLGDVFAGTLVVRERIPVTRTAPLPPPPPWLAAHFAQLDLSRVPDGLWLAVRQYLSRMRQLDPQVGWSMAVKLAADVSERTGTPVPPDMHPAAYLTAVAAERQRRAAERTFGPPHRGGPAGPMTAPAAPYGPPPAQSGPAPAVRPGPPPPVPGGAPAVPDRATPPPHGAPPAQTSAVPPAPPAEPPGAGGRSPQSGGGFTPPS
ncbi:RDD family protein [Streptomyces sodiiphilus]|uniref:RDD family protein n=1 Tax=Streptomyces sodiiphilus TaxID=226217 RepID=A0ABP5B8R0_9ACTN